jgi:hypothetical protein
MAEQHSERVPNKMRSIYDSITALTDRVCAERLDEEYARLARKMTAALSRKRPSPLERGRHDVWACAIVYAIGQQNFLFDRSQTPSMSTAELCAAFGVSPSTAANKAKMIRDLLDIQWMDPEWWRPSMLYEHPIAWLISVNGFIVDARCVPREIQEEAFSLGLIPFLPEPEQHGSSGRQNV